MISSRRDWNGRIKVPDDEKVDCVVVNSWSTNEGWECLDRISNNAIEIKSCSVFFRGVWSWMKFNKYSVLRSSDRPKTVSVRRWNRNNHQTLLSPCLPMPFHLYSMAEPMRISPTTLSASKMSEDDVSADQHVQVTRISPNDPLSPHAGRKKRRRQKKDYLTAHGHINVNRTKKRRRREFPTTTTDTDHRVQPKYRQVEVTFSRKYPVNQCRTRLSISRRPARTAMIFRVSSKFKDTIEVLWIGSWSLQWCVTHFLSRMRKRSNRNPNTTLTMNMSMLNDRKRRFSRPWLNRPKIISKTTHPLLFIK